MIEKQDQINNFKERALKWASEGTPEQKSHMNTLLPYLSRVQLELYDLQTGQRQEKDHPHHTPNELYRELIHLIKYAALSMKEIKTGTPSETISSVLKKQPVLV